MFLSHFKSFSLAKIVATFVLFASPGLIWATGLRGPGPAWYCDRPSFFANVLDVAYEVYRRIEILFPFVILASVLFFSIRYLRYDRKQFGLFTLFSAPALLVLVTLLFLILSLTHFLVFDSLNYDDLVILVLLGVFTIGAPVAVLLYALGFMLKKDKRWRLPLVTTVILAGLGFFMLMFNVFIGPGSSVGDYPSTLFCSEWVFKDISVPHLPLAPKTAH